MKEPNIEKLWEIIDSYYNGKHHQMRDQIRAYGVRRFIIDAYECIDVREYMPEMSNAAYSAIVYWFFRD